MPIFLFQLGTRLLIIIMTPSPACQSVQNSQFLQSICLKILDRLEGLLNTMVITQPLFFQPKRQIHFFDALIDVFISAVCFSQEKAIVPLLKS